MKKEKKCNKCEEVKLIFEFYKTTKSSDGYKTYCKSCLKKQRLDKIDDLKKYSKEYYNNNKEILLDNQKKYNEKNKEKLKNKRKKDREKTLLRERVYREKNKEKIKAQEKEYKEKNKEKIKAQRKEYYLKNKEHILQKNNEWRRKNIHTTIWRDTLRSQLRRFDTPKEGRTIDILGYSSIELKNHIESLFKENMSWNNYGDWEIDHIKPVTKFEKNTPPNIVNALENLQPLWRSENRSKFNKYQNE